MARDTWQPGKGTYPVDQLYAVFDDRDGALLARDRLTEAGWKADDILAFYGAEDAAELRVREERTWHQRLRNWWWALSMYPTPSCSDRIGKVEDGKAILYVHCPDDERPAVAGRLLAGAGGYELVHFGRWAVEHFSMEPLAKVAVSNSAGDEPLPDNRQPQEPELAGSLR